MFARSLGDDGAEAAPPRTVAGPGVPDPHGARAGVHRAAHRAAGRRRGPGVEPLLPQSYAEKAAADTGRIYGIWTDGKLVGGVLFRTMDVEQGTAEAGCWLEPSAVGKGLVTRAARVIIDWAVEERGIHRVEWIASAANEASIAVARRLGMTKDGVLRESRLYRGKRRDLEVWSVLAPEWRAGRRP